MTKFTLLRLPEVIEQTQLSRSSIYWGVKCGSFPSPVKVGARAVRWKSEDIQEWRSGLRASLQSDRLGSI